jgi:hypothetical protein
MDSAVLPAGTPQPALSLSGVSTLRCGFQRTQPNLTSTGTDRQRFSPPQRFLTDRARSIGFPADGTASQSWSAPLCHKVLIIGMHDEG